MPEKLKKEIKKLLFVSATSSFSGSFIGAIYTLFLVQRGLSLFQAAIINTIFHLAVPFLEVPTGAFADTFGRKKSYLLAEILWAVSFGIYALSHTFWQFACAEIIAAFAVTFASGCFDAHVWETITFQGESSGLDETEVGSINRSMWTYEVLLTRIVAAVGGFVGAKVFSANPAAPWILASLFCVADAIIAYLLLKEPFQKKITSYSDQIKKFLGNMIKAVKTCTKDKELRRFSVINALLRYAWAPLFMFWSVLLKNQSKGLEIIAYAWIVIELSVGLGASIGKWLSKYFREKAIARLGAVIGVIGFLTAFVGSNVYASMTGIILVEMAISISGFGYDMSLQATISRLGHGEIGAENNLRASILSFNSMTGAIGGAASLALGGYLAQNSSILNVWALSVIPLSAIVIILKKN